MKVALLCPTLCDPMDYTVHGILQARVLEWVDFPFSKGSSQPRDRTQVSQIAGRFFTAEPPGKPKNTGVGGYPFFRRFSWPRNQTKIPALQQQSLLAELPKKPYIQKSLILTSHHIQNLLKYSMYPYINLKLYILQKKLQKKIFETLN